MDSYQNPKPGKTYISPSLSSFGESKKKVRIASKVLPSEDGYEYAKERDEIVLRNKPDASTNITAKFLEDSRNVFVLTVQKFMNETGKPYGSGFSFVGEEIGKFCEFLANIQSVNFTSDKAVNITDEELRKIAITNNQAKKIVSENQGLFAEVLKSELTTEDLVAVGYRKKQLDTFKKLLTDSDYFQYAKEQKKARGPEDLWQKFFEKNTWIFGYSLDFIFNSTLDGKKLEQTVKGFDFNSSGKRVDGLMKSTGIINSLCFTEIKHHSTKLLKQVKDSYRGECWAISEELAGAVAQIQKTVQKSLENIGTKTEIKDKDGFLTGETVFLYKPKSVIVIGSLDEFTKDDRINEDKFSSFQLFRRDLKDTEIITFDELYERARHIVSSLESGTEES